MSEITIATRARDRVPAAAIRCLVRDLTHGEAVWTRTKFGERFDGETAKGVPVRATIGGSDGMEAFVISQGNGRIRSEPHYELVERTLEHGQRQLRIEVGGFAPPRTVTLVIREILSRLPQ